MNRMGRCAVCLLSLAASAAFGFAHMPANRLPSGQALPKGPAAKPIVKAKNPSSLTIDVRFECPYIHVKGHLDPGIKNAAVTIQYLIVGDADVPRSVHTDAAGNFEDFVTLPQQRWLVQASWNGDTDHSASNSNEAWVNVEKCKPPPRPTQVSPQRVQAVPTLEATKRSVLAIDARFECPYIHVKGHLEPVVKNAAVKVQYVIVGEIEVPRAIHTDAAGNFEDFASFPGEPQRWLVQASWDGDADHSRSVSNEVWVKAEKCTPPVPRPRTSPLTPTTPK